MPVARQHERGVVLALVLILALLLSASIMAFTRRAVIDSTLIHNRDAVAQAEALARGGVRLATFALLIDLLAEHDPEASGAAPGDTRLDLWADPLSSLRLQTPDGGELRIEVRDQGGRLNLNILIDRADPDAQAEEEAVEFLRDVIETVIDELPIPPGERALYDARELAQNLLDYMDSNDVRFRGGDEGSWYQQQTPRYRPADGPLLSVEELRRVQGFDPLLAAGLRPYVTVFPLGGGSGINLNTADPHVLKMLHHGTSGDLRRASEDTIRRILALRQNGQILCHEAGADDRCIAVNEILDGNIYPAVSLPSQSRVFTVEATARVGEIERTVETVIDRSDPLEPRLLAWRVR